MATPEFASRLPIALQTHQDWWEEIDTPNPVVDLDLLETNVARMATEVRARGIALRPHFKTHKCLEVADLQRRHGAEGQTCATLGEAEVLADAGFADVFVAYPVWPGGPKRRRLRDLHERISLTVGVDSVEGAEALGAATRGTGAALRVLVEIDTGGRRTGVPPRDAADVAAAVDRAGLELGGVFTHGGHSYGLGNTAARAAREEVDGLAAAAEGLERHGFETPVVSAGSTPTALLSAEGLVTEVRPGTYVFGDRQQVAIGSCRPDDVALVVASTVVSLAVEGQLVLDAGAKSLARESQPWLTGYGALASWPDVAVERLYDHHGVTAVPDSETGPPVGSVVAVVPNHVCPTVNLARDLVVVRGDAIAGRWKVAAASVV
jgi:D-serine deaminase-like pyridoxal phosphate-dependent protein